MAAAGFGNLIGNFLQAFTQSKLVSQKTKDQEEERKVRTKLFELQLKQAQEQQSAAERIRSSLAPQAMPNPGFQDAPGGLGLERTVQPQQPMSLTRLLSDPEHALDLLQSGMFKDLASFSSAQQGAEMRDRMMNMLGGGGAPSGMELTGLSLDSSGNPMPDFGLPQITTQTVQTQEGPRIRSLNARTGATVAELGAPPDETIDVNEAGRLQGLFGAQELVRDLKSGFLDASGGVNRAAVLSAFGSGVPFTVGRTLSSQFEDAADAVIRARTGATANVEEIQGIARQFKPSPLDSDDTIRDKLERFERFSAGALDAVTLPPRLRALADKVGATGALVTKFDGFKIVDDGEED